MNYQQSYEPIKERNLFIYVFLLPIVSIVVCTISYVGIFAAAVGTEAMAYGAYNSSTALGVGAGLSAGAIALGIFLSLLMLAAVIYFIVIWTGVSRDINIMCAGDPQSTPLMPFAGAYVIGALVPFGFIYLFYYFYKMQDKMQRNAYRYNANVTWSPLAVLLFAIFINIVAYALVIVSFNEMARCYNATAESGYAPNNNNMGSNGNLAGELVEPFQNISAAAAGQGLLRCTAGEIAGASIIMNNGDNLVIGRDPQTANVVLRGDKKVSRRHCVVSYRNGVFYVTDCSTNGTRLANGQKLVSGQETPVGSQADFRISEQTSFAVQIKPN